MSPNGNTDELNAQVEKALTEAVSRMHDGGAMLTGYVTLMTWVDAEGERHWARFNQPDQDEYRSLGMVEHLHQTYADEFAFGIDEDDEP